MLGGGQDETAAATDAVQSGLEPGFVSNLAAIGIQKITMAASAGKNRDGFRQWAVL
jgi:hypothetical protein